MKKILSLLSCEKFLVVILSLILLSFSYGPLVKNYLSTPPAGKVFLGSFAYPPDFWGNILNFQRGRLGHLQTTNKFTTTIPSSGNFMKIEYVLLGQISRLFPGNPIVFFHLSRFVLSIIFLIVSYKLISLIFKNKTEKLIAFTLAFFSTGINPVKEETFFTIWSPIAVFQRSAYFPHYLLAFIFVILSIITLSQALSQRNIKKLLLASFFGFLTSQFHAFNMVSLFLTFPFYLLFLFFPRKNYISFLKSQAYKLFYLLIFTFISSLPLIYAWKIGQSFPWNLLSQNDLKFNVITLVSPQNFILGIGPTLLLGIIGAIIILKRKDDLSLLLAPWSIVYFLGFEYAWKFIPFNSQRFIQTPFFVFLGILSTIALFKIFKKAAVFIAIIIILASVPNMGASLSANIDNFKDLDDYLYYSTPENLQAISWLGKNTKEKEIVLAHMANAELISVLAGNFVYANIHTFELNNFADLEKSIEDFYRPKQDPEFAKKFIYDNKISYIFWSEDEKKLVYSQKLNYDFLKIVYQNPKVTIYKPTFSLE